MSALAGLEPWLQPSAESFYSYVAVPTAKHYGCAAQITSVRRSRAEQTKLYRRYLSGQSRFPAAPPGRSLHEHGRAFDMVVMQGRTLRRDILTALGHYWQSLGGRWYPSDVIHFEA